MKDTFLWLTLVLMLVFCFSNKKNNIISIVTRQLFVYKDARNDRFYWKDIIIFVFAPFIISGIIVYGLEMIIPQSTIEQIITIVSIFFGLFLSFVGLLIPCINSNNDRVKYIKETFITTLFCMILSILILTYDVICLTIPESTYNHTIYSFINIVILCELMFCIFLLIKRIYNIFYD